jgi:biotin carboxyl carrier protein
MAQRQAVLSQVPVFPRRPAAYDAAIFARLIKTTLETGFAHPSRLLAYYIKRLVPPAARPLAPLEVVWQLAEELGIPLYEEERQQGEALRQASEMLWHALGRSAGRFTALCRASPEHWQHNPDYAWLIECLKASDAALTSEAATALLQELLAWLRAPVPAIQALIEALERTQLQRLLAANDDLSLTRPAYLDHAATVVQLHRLLSHVLRPTTLRAGELLSPMEATIYHRPEPNAPPFVEIGMEVSVGQTLALLEAMKMFSELPSPVEGVITDILVEDGQGVKTGEPLFKIATQNTAVDLSVDSLLPQLSTDEFQNDFGLLLT